MAQRTFAAGGHEPYDAKADLWSVASLVDLGDDTGHGCINGYQGLMYSSQIIEMAVLNGKQWPVILLYKDGYQ